MIPHQPAYCKACASPLRSEIDRHFSQSETLRTIASYTEGAGHPISYETLRKHRAHAIDPKLAELEQRPPGEKRELPSIKVSSTDFLEAVVNEGHRQVTENPNKVKLDQAIRAATVLERKKEDGKGGMRVLILALTGQTPPVTIRGNYEQLEGSN